MLFHICYFKLLNTIILAFLAAKEALKASLPTIKETITIKDGINLKMETYQTGDTYVTILLSDDTPFAYVTSDAELNMVNHVTTYYVSDIAAS